MDATATISKCENCGKKFPQPNKYRVAKTCSRECRYALAGKSNRMTQGPQYIDRECPQCGATFSGKTTYCSRICSNKARSGTEHPAVVRVMEQGGYPSCSVCGEPTQHTQRKTCPAHRHPPKATQEPATCPCGAPARNLRSKYCSDEHQRKWGRKPPTEMVTKVCVGCGKEFTRPWFYPGKLKYCSNKCSHHEQKKVRDKFILDLNEHAVVFHSGWEVRFWALCLRFGFPVRRYDGDDIQTPEGVYRPDFIVTTSGGEVVVEMKGYVRPEAAVKINAARELGHQIVVFNSPRLVALEEGDFWNMEHELLSGTQEPLPGMI